MNEKNRLRAVFFIGFARGLKKKADVLGIDLTVVYDTAIRNVPRLSKDIKQL